VFIIKKTAIRDGIKKKKTIEEVFLIFQKLILQLFQPPYLKIVLVFQPKHQSKKYIKVRTQF